MKPISTCNKNTNKLNSTGTVVKTEVKTLPPPPHRLRVKLLLSRDTNGSRFTLKFTMREGTL